MQDKKIREIAIYGKGGIGKSTIASNVAIALTEMGEKVFQIGCSPKIDSTSLLNGGEILDVNILEQIREKGDSKESIRECIVEGYKGILCAETGGPLPATGCAGKGVKIALDLLKEYNLIKDLGATFVIYDVIGDVVCGGFGEPMREGFAEEIYIVSSGELMSMYSANNICISVKVAIEEGADVRVGGIINNMRGVPFEKELIEEFGKMLSVDILAHVPRDKIVQQTESEGGTVLEKRSDSPMGKIYRGLAENIKKGNKFTPTPVSLEDLLKLLRKYQERSFSTFK